MSRTVMNRWSVGFVLLSLLGLLAPLPSSPEKHAAIVLIEAAYEKVHATWPTGT